MFRATPVALMFAAALTATPAFAQTMTAKQYLMKSGASDQFEIQSSKLMLQSSQDPKIQQFANQMITDHTNSTNQLKAAAQQSGIAVPPPHLDSMQAKNISKLKAAKGPARDSLYVDQQKMSHQMALQLQQSYASNGDNPALKTTASAIVPVVQSHIDMLNTMGSTGSTM